MRRIERLINLIAALLEAPRPLTAQEIRADIAGYDQPNDAAFRRAFERDKEALRALGIPVETVASDPLHEAQTDAYTIPKSSYYLPELDLEPDELAALRIAAEAVLGGDAAQTGFRKLALDEPASLATGPRVVWGADVAAEQPLLGPLYSAVLDHRPVSFAYTPAGGTRRQPRTVEPYSLLHRRGHWYVIGRDVERDDIRSFKVSRMSGRLEMLEGSFQVPPSFDASERLSGEAWMIGADEILTVTVRFDESLRWWAEQNLPDAPAAEGPGGALDVELRVANTDALLSWIVGFGPAAEILSPPEVRARLIAHLGPWLEAPAEASP